MEPEGTKGERGREDAAAFHSQNMPMSPPSQKLSGPPIILYNNVKQFLMKIPIGIF